MGSTYAKEENLPQTHSGTYIYRRNEAYTPTIFQVHIVESMMNCTIPLNPVRIVRAPSIFSTIKVKP